MEMRPVVSGAVRAVGYDATTRVMRVAFRSGGVYDYFDVAADLYAQMLRPHPWHRVGHQVRHHRFRRL